MRKLARGLVVAGAMAAGLTLAPAAQAADLGTTQVVSTIDAPMGVLTCTTAYDSKLAANPFRPVPTYGILFVNATGTYNYVLYDAGATVGYGICIAI
jgi:hypothetical protein